jgi:hypothetical protein
MFSLTTARIVRRTVLAMLIQKSGHVAPASSHVFETQHDKPGTHEMEVSVLRILWPERRT